MPAWAASAPEGVRHAARPVRLLEPGASMPPELPFADVQRALGAPAAELPSGAWHSTFGIGVEF